MHECSTWLPVDDMVEEPIQTIDGADMLAACVGYARPVVPGSALTAVDPLSLISNEILQSLAVSVGDSKLLCA